MTKIIAWPHPCGAGEVAIIDPIRLVQADFILDGEMYLHRPALKSLIDQGLILLTDEVFALAYIVNAGFVESAAHVAMGDFKEAFEALISTSDAEGRLMALVGKDSNYRPWVSSVLLAGSYNQLVTLGRVTRDDKQKLLSMIDEDLEDIGNIRRRINNAKEPKDPIEKIHNLQRLDSLDRVERDLKVIASATKSL